ncbi:MAG: hypothetical protein U0792_17915 [Gemmataceae bacterium]
MESKTVVEKLTEILRDYQEPGQNPTNEPITSDTKPLADVKGFDSHFIPEIVRRLAKELGHPLGKGARVRNIFVERGKKLTVREIARKFIEKHAPKECTV